MPEHTSSHHTVGPAAELGMTVARLVGLKFLPDKPQSQHLRRSLFLAGAGAGLAANFDTPFTGVFYALEVGAYFKVAGNVLLFLRLRRPS
jgi:H+/Cl- antiporter ClcA